ncbi:MAG: signal peptidase I [Ardenticatenaceae bacterium]|nr:signal peptidase I [Ardenticatenaceae bacterium]
MTFKDDTQNQMQTPLNGTTASGWQEAARLELAEMPPAGGEEEEQSYQQPTELVVREIIETLLLTFFIFWLVNGLIGRYRIDGSSMNPTLVDGEYLIINNLSYYLDEPQRGDVIVFRHPNNELNLIKRVIGLPGDTVEIKDGQVIVNGVVLDEPYIKAAPNYNGRWDVPEDNYFVLGDNRNNSSDSHSWSYLPEGNIIGKAEVIYWPPQEWIVVPHHLFNLEVQATADGQDSN